MSVDTLPRTLQIAALAACGVIVVAGLRTAAPILTPFALALFIAAVSLPLLNWLRSHGAPMAVAILLIVMLDAAVLTFFGWIIAQSVAELREAFPHYLARTQEIEQTVRAQFLAWGIEIPPDTYANLVRPEALLDTLAMVARNLTTMVTVAVLVLLYLVFILAESVILPHKLRIAFGNRWNELGGTARIITEVQRYLALKTLVSLVTGTLVGAAAGLIGVDFALFWGFLAFALNYIPTFGSIFAAIPAILVAMLQLGPGPALALAVVYLSVNVVIGNFADPILLGKQLRLSTLVVLLSLVFWGWTWGPIGMFLAVPITIALRIAMENTVSLRSVAILMGPRERRAALRLPGDAPEEHVLP